MLFEPGSAQVSQDGQRIECKFVSGFGVIAAIMVLAFVYCERKPLAWSMAYMWFGDGIAKETARFRAEVLEEQVACLERMKLDPREIEYFKEYRVLNLDTYDGQMFRTLRYELNVVQYKVWRKFHRRIDIAHAFVGGYCIVLALFIVIGIRSLIASQ